MKDNPLYITSEHAKVVSTATIESLSGHVDNQAGAVDEVFLRKIAKLMKKHKVNRVDLWWARFYNKP